MTAPQWLSNRGGALKLGSDGKTWFVVFADRPNYALNTVPAGGKFGCHIKQTINGRRIDCNTTFAGPDEALRGGLEDLRKFLGWE